MHRKTDLNVFFSHRVHFTYQLLGCLCPAGSRALFCLPLVPPGREDPPPVRDDFLELSGTDEAPDLVLDKELPP